MTQGQTERLKGHSPECLTPAVRGRGDYITVWRLRKTLDLLEDSDPLGGKHFEGNNSLREKVFNHPVFLFVVRSAVVTLRKEQ